MKITIIKYFFKFTKVKTSYYTFKQEEHELVLLKKLDDNKIIYNSQIYDKDFFEYYKLEAFVQKIYDIRDFELKGLFKNYYENAKKKKYHREILNPNPWESLNWENLTLTQYNMLVKCYKYDICYPFKYDLLDPELEIPRDTKITTLFNDWFYIVGWKSLKPVFPIFKTLGIQVYYEDEPWTVDKKLVVRHEYDPFDEGTRPLFESYEEYDEQKKFNEFDFNSKTNSYHMRYKAYNEVYYKDYPEEKKFKTDLIHINDFTEEELQENYENMINKEKPAIEKWEYVMLNEKNRKAVFDFFSKLESIEVSEEILEYPKWTWWYEELQDSDTALAKKIEKQVDELLNNPRYLLIMPLVDAYFEIFRTKGWYDEDQSFVQYYPTNKKILKHLAYFDFSYERHYKFAKEEILIYDYVDVDLEEFEDDLFWCAFFLFIWLNGVMLYTFCFWFMHYNYHDTLFQIVPEYLNSVTNYIIQKPKIYYGLELRSPRSFYGRKRYCKPCFTKYRFSVGRPTNFFFDSHYRLRLNSSHNWAPFSILDKLCEDLDEKDYGLKKIDEDMRAFSYKYGIYRLRIYGIEEQVSESEQLFVPKLKKWSKEFIFWAGAHAKVYLWKFQEWYWPDEPLYWPKERQDAYYEALRIEELRKKAELLAELEAKERAAKKWYNITKYF